MKITGAIFDMDGTLLDSMDYWASAPSEFLRQNGIVPPPDAGRFFLEKGMTSAHKLWSEECGLTLSLEETREQIYAITKKGYESNVRVKAGARELLDRLKANGVKMCLATATDRDVVEAVLKRLGIDSYFSRIFTCTEVGKGKAFPLIYETALDYLGTDKETTYIFEDAHYAIVTAKGAGFKVVGIYDRNVYVPKDEIKALCDIYLDEDDKYNLP